VSSASDEQGLSRRDRARAQTSTDILRVARRVLIEEGPEGVALRAIARELGMTAPALYRYYSSREALLNHLVASLYDEVTAELRRAQAAVDDPVLQLLEVARQFRIWALSHRREFGLVFAYPVRMTGDEVTDDPATPAGLRFAAVFAESLATLYQQAPFEIPGDTEIEPALRRQLGAWQRRFPIKLPLGALQIFLTGWIRIYGMVCMEVFGHLRFALADGEPMYEHEIQVLAQTLRRPAMRPQRRARQR
jgi:AcrR family transcriptional regulator